MASPRRAGSARSISLNTLRKAAVALECELVVVLLPRTSLETAVREQAKRKAVAERNRLVHTMRLEQQEPGVEEVLNLEASVDSWLTNRSRKLWD